MNAFFAHINCRLKHQMSPPSDAQAALADVNDDTIG